MDSANWSKQPFWHRFKTALLDALFPPCCLVCRHFGGSDQTDRIKATEGCFCTACQEAVKRVESPFCSTCGIPFTGRQGDNHLCGDCIEEPPQFDLARAVGAYDDSLKQAIYHFKYGGKIELAKPLGRMLAVAFEKFWPQAKVDLVLPVPLYIGKQRKRGFNQSYLLVRGWRQTGRETGFTIDRDLLVRVRKTASQTGLNRIERRRNVKGAFAVNSAKKLKGKHILLIDDVYTTGATVGECAKMLKKKGAERVDVLTLARAL